MVLSSKDGRGLRLSASMSETADCNWNTSSSSVAMAVPDNAASAFWSLLALDPSFTLEMDRLSPANVEETGQSRDVGLAAGFLNMPSLDEAATCEQEVLVVLFPLRDEAGSF